jgi:hypothetical protein
MDVSERLANAAAMSGVRGRPGTTGTDRQPPFFDGPNTAFLAARGHLAPNVYAVDIENAAFDESYFTVNSRLSDLVNPTASTVQKPDQLKIVKPLVTVGFLHMGTKVRFSILAGQGKDTWLVVSPENTASDIASAQIRKCNRRWNRLDYFGNLLSEPFILNEYNVTSIDGNERNSSTDILTPRDAAPCLMQRNERTKDLKDGDKIVFPDGLTFFVRGMNNSSREFTDDADSVRMLHFTLYKVPEDRASDDLVNGIVDGNRSRWEMTVPVTAFTVMAGDAGNIPVTVLRNGVVPERAYHLDWVSSDPSVLTVDENGNYQALGLGAARVSCVLRENSDVRVYTDITVENMVPDAFELAFELAFDPALPLSLRQGQSVTVAAFVKNNRQRHDMPVSITFAGLSGRHYEVTERTGNSAVVRCIAPARDWLTVTARASLAGEALEVTHNMQLMGV